MSNWSAWQMTDGGAKLLNDVLAGKLKMEFTRICIGNGNNENITQMTDLSSPMQNAEIKSVKARADNTCVINYMVTNSEVAESYPMTEMGLFVDDGFGGEVLYMVAVDDTPDYMPVANGTSALWQEMQLIISLGQVDEVTLKPTPEGYIRVEELQPADDGSINEIIGGL